MKKLLLAVLAMTALCLSSCNKPDENPMYLGYGLATLRPQADGSWYIKATDQLALVATNENLKKYPFADGKEHRAAIQFGYDPQNPGTSVVPGYEKTQEIVMYQIDTILTKQPLVYEEEKDDSYGKASMGLYLTDQVFPTTVVEDGYLVVCLALPCGDMGAVHTVDLLTGVDPDDPYTVELRHHMHGDDYIDTDDAVYCFPLRSLPDTEGKTVKLTLRWQSLVSGAMEKTEFDYCTRTDW